MKQRIPTFDAFVNESKTRYKGQVWDDDIHDKYDKLSKQNKEKMWKELNIPDDWKFDKFAEFPADIQQQIYKWLNKKIS